MKILSVISAKGGVGKSTISTNISVALRQRGHRVLAVDIDPQNGLHTHFFLEPHTRAGLANAKAAGKALRKLIQPTRSGVALLPYGECSEVERQHFENSLIQNPEWLKENLLSLNMGPDVVVVLDTPPGPSVYMAQALSAASVVLIVTLSDAGSYRTLPKMQSLIDTYCTGRPSFSTYGFIVNQVDRSRMLSKDVTQVLQTRFKDKIAGLVHLDQAVSEALAHGRDVFSYRPHSEAWRDIMDCAQWVERQFCIEPGSAL